MNLVITIVVILILFSALTSIKRFFILLIGVTLWYVFMMNIESIPFVRLFVVYIIPHGTIGLLLAVEDDNDDYY